MANGSAFIGDFLLSSNCTRATVTEEATRRCAGEDFSLPRRKVSRLARDRVNRNENTNNENEHRNDDDNKHSASFWNRAIPLLFAVPCCNILRNSGPRSDSLSCHSRRIHRGLKTECPRRGGCPTARPRRAPSLQACVEWLRRTHSQRPIEGAAERSARRVH